MAETQDILYHSKGISKKYNRQVLLAMVPTIAALIIIVPVGLSFSTSQRYSGGLVISGSGAGIVLLLAALCIGMIVGNLRRRDEMRRSEVKIYVSHLEYTNGKDGKVQTIQFEEVESVAASETWEDCLELKLKGKKNALLIPLKGKCQKPLSILQEKMREK